MAYPSGCEGKNKHRFAGAAPEYDPGEKVTAGPENSGTAVIVSHKVANTMASLNGSSEGLGRVQEECLTKLVITG